MILNARASTLLESGKISYIIIASFTCLLLGISVAIFIMTYCCKNFNEEIIDSAVMISNKQAKLYTDCKDKPLS